MIWVIAPLFVTGCLSAPTATSTSSSSSSSSSSSTGPNGVVYSVTQQFTSSSGIPNITTTLGSINMTAAAIKNQTDQAIAAMQIQKEAFAAIPSPSLMFAGMQNQNQMFAGMRSPNLMFASMGTPNSMFPSMKSRNPMFPAMPTIAPFSFVKKISSSIGKAIKGTNSALSNKVQQTFVPVFEPINFFQPMPFDLAFF